MPFPLSELDLVVRTQIHDLLDVSAVIINEPLSRVKVSMFKVATRDPDQAARKQTRPLMPAAKETASSPKAACHVHFRLLAQCHGFPATGGGAPMTTLAGFQQGRRVSVKATT